MKHINKISFFKVALLISFLFSSTLVFSKDNTVKDEKKEVSPFEMVQMYLKKTDQTINGLKFESYAFGFSKPIYGTFISYGFEYGICKCDKFVTHDAGLLMKLTSPSVSIVGVTVALTSTCIAGFSALPYVNTDTSLFSFDKRTGGHLALSVGAEIFATKWLGFCVEYQNRYYWTNPNSNSDKSASKEPFNPSFNNLFVLSIRTTW